MSGSHAGRVAVVTGAAQGIGRAIAELLAARGAALVLVDLGPVDEVRGAIGGDPLCIQADISDDAEWARIAALAHERHGRADIVVNNAGIYPTCPFDDLDAALWRKTFAVNIDSHFYSAKHFVPLMRRNRWGRFVNISSNSIGYAIPGMSHYMASKMAVIGFVRGLANDLGEDGITVNAVLPAPTVTPGTSAMSASFDMLARTQAIKRVAQAGDMAGPVAFLTSDDAAFITGQAVVVDGGAYKIS